MRWVLVVCAACKAAPAPPPPSPEPVAQPALPDAPFSALDREQRAELMKERVVPELAPIFQRRDPARYAAFGCATCHGPGAASGRYEMPNPQLVHLGEATMLDRRAVEWMTAEVTPAIARLVGPVECRTCHVEE